MSSYVGHNPTFFVKNLWWYIVMDDWNVDGTSLGKWQWLQHYKSIIPQNIDKKDK